MSRSNRMTHDEILASDAIRHIRRVLEENEVDSDCASFWYSRCIELLNIYRGIKKEHPEDLDGMTMDDIMIAFARQAYYYAFQQR